MELWDSKKKLNKNSWRSAMLKKKGWDVHLGKGNQKDEMLSQKKLEKVQHRAIHVAFIILGDLVGIYKAKEVNDYVFKELWFVWN